MTRTRISTVVFLLWAAAARAQESPIVTASEKAAAAAVSIKVTRETESKPPPAGNPHQTGGVFQARPNGTPVSGTVWSDDGYILTSYYNVKNDPKGNGGAVKEIEVTLADGTTHPAELVGFHQDADIALLKIDAKGLATLKPTALEILKTGTNVVALGRCPAGKNLTVNAGILSAPGRMRSRAIQIDCKLNYGNVGGPLVDLEGRLVGVTCKVDSKPISAASIGQNSGVSFAVTVDKLTEMMADLKKGLKITGTGLPFLGIRPDPAYTDEGVKLLAVEAGSAAELAGLKIGDVIILMDGKKTKNFDELRAIIIKKAIGDKVEVVVQRTVATPEGAEEAKELKIDVTMGERPGE